MTRQLRVSIPGNILYVSGTVNEIAVVWTLEGGAWQAIAERSADDVYEVALTAVPAGGGVVEAHTTLYYGLHLVTDRTARDVADGTEKGFYNASDLSRVGAACGYVAGRLRACGYAAEVVTKIDWTMADIPTESDMARYLENVRVLRGVLALGDGTPGAPERIGNTSADPENPNGLDWQGANDMEQILEDVDDSIVRMMAAYCYAGEIYGGEL